MDDNTPLDMLDYIFDNLRVPHIYMQQAHKCFDRLRKTRRRIINGTAFAAEAKCATLFADTQSGKSTIVKSYVEKSIVDYCYSIGLFPDATPRKVVAKLQRKVIFITVSGTSTLTSLLEDILRAFGDPRPERGLHGPKKQRILNYINQFETELLIFDEMNHLKIGSASNTVQNEATRVHNNLKDLLIGGCPIVFVGTREAEAKVFSDSQIRGRCREKLFIGPLDYKNRTHREAFREFCGILGLELKRHGLFPERSNFVEERVVGNLFTASGGYFGHATNLIALAARYALEEGADQVKWEHLSAASDEYTMFNRLQNFNPFLKGAIPQSVDRMGATHA